MEKRLDKARNDMFHSIASKFRDEKKKLGNEMERVHGAETGVKRRERGIKGVARHDVREVEADDLN